MNVSYAVMAHTSRAEAVWRLTSLIGGPLAITVDSGALGETRNGDLAWGSYAPDGDWHVVVQDDALPVPEFRRHVDAALAASPPAVVSLYVGTGRPHQPKVARLIREANTRDAAWIETPDLWWGVGVAMPTGVVEAFLTWGMDRDGPYDQRIGAFAREAGLPVRSTWPSLVDHADGPTLLAHAWGPPRTSRRAHRIGARLDWDTEVVS